MVWKNEVNVWRRWVMDRERRVEYETSWAQAGAEWKLEVQSPESKNQS